MNDLISRQQAIDAVEKSMYENPHENAIIRGMHDHEHRHFLTILMGLPSVQPERKDALEKAVVVEAISDELMSRFDISATYAYEVAETAINRIEAMAKELERGEQE
jgi:hypothetical protein